ncbi:MULTISPECIES: hypothetical protein [Rossellomorea]|jgi:hypothetical protein|uniref:hypothetical protein n=1 Tax=Rossellomorea TaxID=2837508 RepID=UPI0011E93AE1|nr:MULTISPECIES: hypothetical protein [Rossellomorea]TYS91798.1 hypothetical protein FZC88_06600 [Rossellomorea aquimaris]
MVFLLFSVELILFIGGLYGLSIHETTLQFIIFTGLIVLSVIMFISTIVYYQRKKHKRERTNDCWDCAIYSPDCLPFPRGKKFDCDSPDCDCTPDCSP